ncbi:phosphonate C-P lyase system protein PhnH [Noviherbaspirillum sp. Root189]|uniref:phosphonate C-P lyase system protein PhnH n=1 Tax=Noviherbaspirillum sp. Root189 TaxID=1736487 RepID=UPI00070AF28E|nr:phosphonate C-P lyase system protein PhnH [Noviherbaspirillum sp. Root189]KRB93132.1 hypothetical protein ASE07_14290 [Noviherbaspirillum sp. Root189]
MNAELNDALVPAWEDSVSASQATFRTLLDAMASPGRICRLPMTSNTPAPFNAATTALCLSLADLDTPVWLDAHVRSNAVSSFLRFHCGCALTDDPAQAVFAVLSSTENIDFACFAQGSMEYPDRSTTLFVQASGLREGARYTLSGPGIRDTAELRVTGLSEHFSQAWRRNNAGFPLGVDLVFCCGDELVALPRTTQILE